MKGGQVFPGWQEPRGLKWARNHAGEQVMAHAAPGRVEPFLRVYESAAEPLRVMVGWSQQDGWHLSISNPQRYPTWDEIRDARYDLVPDGHTLAMLLPPKGEYVNVHPNCFHLHEIDDP